MQSTLLHRPVSLLLCKQTVTSKTSPLAMAMACMKLSIFCVIPHVVIGIHYNQSSSVIIANSFLNINLCILYDSPNTDGPNQHMVRSTIACVMARATLFVPTSLARFHSHKAPTDCTSSPILKGIHHDCIIKARDAVTLA